MARVSRYSPAGIRKRSVELRQRIEARANQIYDLKKVKTKTKRQAAQLQRLRALERERVRREHKHITFNVSTSTVNKALSLYEKQIRQSEIKDHEPVPRPYYPRFGKLYVDFEITREAIRANPLEAIRVLQMSARAHEQYRHGVRNINPFDGYDISMFFPEMYYYH